MSIRIFYDRVSYRYPGWLKLKNLLSEIIEGKKMFPGDLNIVITGNRNLRSINKEFLEHDYSTDVITFDYNKKKTVNGEIYISLESVRKNAINYKVSLKNEFSRVIIHGVLHLVGFDDSDEEEKSKMTREEDRWLKRLGK